MKSGSKHSGSSLNPSSHTNLPCENFDLLDQCEHETKGYWNVKNAVAKICGKKQIDEVSKLRLLNETSLE